MGIRKESILRCSEITNSVFDKLRTENSNNMVFSPFSLIKALCLLGDSTAGNTKMEIVKLLCESISFDEFSEDCCKLQKVLMGAGGLSSADAVIVAESLSSQVDPDYKDRIITKNGAGFFATDNIVEAINKWTKEKTLGMIEEIADDSMRDALFSILSAVAFVADWEEDYEDINIGRKKFHNADGSTSEVMMLHSREDCYIENDSFKGFCKPYKNMGYSFMALIPKDDKTKLQEYKEKINFLDLFTNRKNEKVIVNLPEFETGYRKSLTGMLADLGIIEAFVPGCANLSPVVNVDLYVGKAIQKAYICVDRNGTKVSAVSMLGSYASGVSFVAPPEVILDRPFVYAIIHNGSGLPIFVGTVNNLADAPREERHRIENEILEIHTELVGLDVEIIEDREIAAKTIYRDICKRTHPDLFPGDEEREKLFYRAVEAYSRCDLLSLQGIYWEADNL